MQIKDTLISNRLMMNLNQTDLRLIKFIRFEEGGNKYQEVEIPITVSFFWSFITDQR